MSAGTQKRKAEEEEAVCKSTSKRQNTSGNAEQMLNQAAAGNAAPTGHAESARILSSHQKSNYKSCPLIRDLKAIWSSSGRDRLYVCIWISEGVMLWKQIIKIVLFMKAHVPIQRSYHKQSSQTHMMSLEACMLIWIMCSWTCKMARQHKDCCNGPSASSLQYLQQRSDSAE